MPLTLLVLIQVFNKSTKMHCEFFPTRQNSPYLALRIFPIIYKFPRPPQCAPYYVQHEFPALVGPPIEFIPDTHFFQKKPYLVSNYTGPLIILNFQYSQIRKIQFKVLLLRFMHIVLLLL